MVGDVVITQDEIHGLMADLLYTESAPAGERKLSDWIREHSSTIGRHYSNELARRTNRLQAYENLT
jgi:NADH dehydrogenase